MKHDKFKTNPFAKAYKAKMDSKHGKSDEKKAGMARKMSGGLPSLFNKKDANKLSDGFKRTKPEAK